MKHLKNIEAAKLTLMGAICGDIIGSAYEERHTKQCDFTLFRWYCRFTDDTVCSVAIADALTRGKSFQGALQYWGRVCHHSGYERMSSIRFALTIRSHTTVMEMAQPCV